MKRTLELISGKKPRDIAPRPFGFMRSTLGKFFNTLLLAAALIAVASAFKPVYAGGSASAYIVLRCTVTLSVALVEPNTWFAFGDVSAGQTLYSPNCVTVRNDSQGAVCNWSLNIDTNTLGGWKLSNVPDLDQVAIYGVFQKTLDTAKFDVVRDSFDATPRQYLTDSGDGGVFACGSYTAEGLNTDEGKLIPYSCAPTRSDRNLWIRLMTPTAVTDVTPRNIQLVITAKMAG